jgi:hypothetical protein
MNETDVFGIEKTVLAETIRHDGGNDVAATKFCTEVCTGLTCLCSVPSEQGETP